METKEIDKGSINANKATRNFLDKAKSSMNKLEREEELRKDKYVNLVFELSESVLRKDLDEASSSWLVAIGGRLTGVHAYLGNKASRARAERDIYEQKRDDVKDELMVEHYNSDSDEKVTLARAKTNLELSQINDLVVQKNKEKNDYENLLDACDKMISFIQSAIKIKNSESFRGNDMYDN